MPANRNALIRYRTIDNCLRNRFRKWTLNDLIDACSDALYEYEGIDKGVSRRTVQADIQVMRSDKLGYNAPIIVLEKKYYTYEDKEYSITNIPLTQQDLGKLSEAVEMLKQFRGFSHFADVGDMVQKLEDKVYSVKNDARSIIDTEKNERLRNFSMLEELYRFIRQKQAIKMAYQSFKAREASDLILHPWILKEYRNRWFILGTRDEGRKVLIFALDRISAVEKSEVDYIEAGEFTAENYFKDIVGVSVMNQKPSNVQLRFNPANAPYVVTKPIHSSQEIIAEEKGFITFNLCVIPNFELERVILGFGASVEVLQPRRLRNRIAEQLKSGLTYYQN